MEFKNIDLLLEKYWAGESSLEEEQSLRLYFNQDEIAERHLSFVSLFRFFAEEQQAELSEDFDEKLFQKLEDSEKDKSVQGLPEQSDLNSKVVPLQKDKPRKKFFVLRIAAAIALLLSCWFFFPKTADPVIAKVDKQEVEEAKIAYQQAKAALLLLSRKMNKGTQTALQGMNELDNATRVVRTKPN